MHTLQACLITLSVLLIGFLLLYTLIQLTQVIMKKKYSIHSLFFNFRQKMWMTVGLGLLFFGFYIFLLYLGSIKLDPKTKLELFVSVYNNPLNYVYLGLLIFISISISIYIVRLGIIYLYNSKKR
jgi:hypothetical protein